jgi:hypothetical protein
MLPVTGLDAVPSKVKGTPVVPPEQDVYPFGIVMTARGFTLLPPQVPPLPGVGVQLLVPGWTFIDTVS